MTTAVLPASPARPVYHLTLVFGLLLLIGSPIVWLGGQFFFTSDVPTNGCIGDRWDCAISPRQRWKWSVGPVAQLAMALGAFIAWVSVIAGYLWTKDRFRIVLSFVALVVLSATTGILASVALYFIIHDCIIIRGFCIGGPYYIAVYGIPAIIFAILLTSLTVGIFKRKKQSGRILLTGTLSAWTGLVVAQIAWIIPLFFYI